VSEFAGSEAMTNNPIFIAGALVAGAILIHGYWSGKVDNRKYQLSAAGNNGQTVWRIDTRNGRLSMCGSISDGASFSAMQEQYFKAVVAVAENPSPEERMKVIQANPEKLAHPNCTDWTEAEGKEED
jgi:hypothetical protein